MVGMVRRVARISGTKSKGGDFLCLGGNSDFNTSEARFNNLGERETWVLFEVAVAFCGLKRSMENPFLPGNRIWGFLGENLELKLLGFLLLFTFAQRLNDRENKKKGRR